MTNIRSGVRLFALLAGVLALLASAGPARAGEGAGENGSRSWWYLLSVEGETAGYTRSGERTADNGVVVTESEMTLGLRRGTVQIDVSMSSSVTETAEGGALSMRSVQKLGQMATTTDYLFQDGKVRVITAQGGQRLENTVDAPAGEWLAPAAAARDFQQRVANGETEITQRVLEPLSGLEPSEVTYRDPEAGVVETRAGALEATRWVVTTSSAPGIESVEWLDADGTPVVSETNLGAIRLRMERCDERTALAAAGATPPELMVSTFVKPSEPIGDPRHAERAVFVLRGLGDLEPPGTSAQAVERVDDGFELTVTAEPVNAEAPATEPDLGASAMINGSDPAVVELAEMAVKGVGDDELDRARAMRRFVHTLIDDKNLSTAFGSASEVARSRSGDCTEHAVLLAAMLRSEGIPSRVAAGLIYADSFAGERAIFGYHMWTRALVTVDGEKVWVDVDATLPGDLDFDATHIALAVSDLSTGGALDAYAAIARAMGGLSIEVVEVEHAPSGAR